MKQAVMFGAGNVGRGFIGQLFSESGYRVTFVDVDRPLMDALNSRGSYVIRLVDNQSEQKVTVGPVRAFHSVEQKAEVVQALAESSLAATAMGARVLPAVAPLLAEGITARWASGRDAPLNIIVCENLKGAAAYLRGLVYGHLSPTVKSYAERQVGFVDTVIGRMAPPPTPEQRAQDPSAIVVEPYKELPVERRSFVGEIPVIAGMAPCENFPVYTARKLYIHNCGHAVLAYLGYQEGFEYGYEALADERIRAQLEQALAESTQGIVTVFHADESWLKAHTRDLMERFTNRALGDTIFRLGRDPLRKLAPTDRLVGAARLAERAGMIPTALSTAIAAGYRFDPPEDPLAVELQQRIAKEGIEAVMTSVSSILPTELLGDRVRAEYGALAARGSERRTKAGIDQ